ncbi:hypothetical protein [Acidisphaera sp. S103]|uniref:hypothetical protein n=1 Tax=Acidisphaera sp. S103 TaxID=1747223 RepID=UPI00131B1C24|nr:hypothetical protein [Acidisphaera sp. S103]
MAALTWPLQDCVILAYGDMSVNRFLAAGASLMMFGASHAFGQTCPGATALTSSQISSLLTGGGGRWACVGNSPNATWNEQHKSGFVLDYKKGPSDPIDPSDTIAHPTGSYSVVSTNPINSQAPGTITYTYGSASYTYTLYANMSGTIPFSSTGTYSFCGSGSAPMLAVTVSASHC